MEATIIIGIEKYKVVAKITVYNFFKSSYSIDEVSTIFQQISKIKELCFDDLKNVSLENSSFIMTPNENENEDTWYKNTNLILTAERSWYKDEEKRYNTLIERYPKATHCPILGKTIFNLKEL